LGRRQVRAQLLQGIHDAGRELPEEPPDHLRREGHGPRPGRHGKHEARTPPGARHGHVLPLRRKRLQRGDGIQLPGRVHDFQPCGPDRGMGRRLSRGELRMAQQGRGAHAPRRRCMALQEQLGLGDLRLRDQRREVLQAMGHNRRGGEAHRVLLAILLRAGAPEDGVHDLHRHPLWRGWADLHVLRLPP